MAIRPYQNKDYKQVLQMLQESMDYHMGIADPPVFKESSEKLLANYLRSMVAKAKTDKGILLVAEESSGKLSGFIYGELPKYSKERARIGKKCGVVNEIYVGVDYRNKGLGSLLVEEIEKVFVKNKCELVLLHDVHRKNVPAISLYEKIGYHVRVSEYVKELKNKLN